MDEGKIHFINSPELFNIRLVQGYQVRHNFAPHLHQTYILGLIREGQVRLESKEEGFNLNSGEAYLIPPFVPHALKMKNNISYSHFVLCFKPIFINMCSNDIDKRLPTQIILWNDYYNKLIYAYLDALLEHSNDISINYTFTIIKELLEILFNSKLIQITSGLSNQNEAHYIRKAKSFIHRNWEQNLDLNGLANKVNMSKYYFVRQFKKIVGLTPYDYLLQFRIKQSKILLKRNYDITTVAYMTKFYDQSHFNKYFKKHTGVTPREYKHYSFKM